MGVPDHAWVLVVPIAGAAHIGLHHADACLCCCNTLHKAAAQDTAGAGSTIQHSTT